MTRDRLKSLNRWTLLIVAVGGLVGCESSVSDNFPSSNPSVILPEELLEQQTPLLPTVPNLPPVNLNTIAITVTVSQLPEILVKSGDIVKKGQTLSHNKTQVQGLLGKKQQLEAELNRAIAPTPSPNLNLKTQQAALNQAQFKLDQAKREISRLQGSLRFDDPRLSEALDANTIREIKEWQEKQREAEVDLQVAQTNMSASKEQYVTDLQAYASRNHQQKQGVNSVLGQLQAVEQQIQAASVRSLYDGQVNSVKILKQDGQNITAEIVLEISQPTPGNKL